MSQNIPINPMLTRFSVAYRNAQESFIGDFILPRVPTNGKKTGTYVTYNRENAFQIPNAEAASQTPANRVNLKKSSASFSCERQALRDGWDEDEAKEALNPISLPRDTTEDVTDLLLLNYERKVITLATTAGNFTNTAAVGTVWSSDSSTPFRDITTAVKTIHQTTGKKPNRFVVGSEVWYDGLQNHAEIVSRVKATTQLASQKNITPSMVGGLFDLDMRVAGTVHNSAKEGQTVSTAFSFGKFALIYYAEPSFSVRRPTFGATFTQRDFTTRKWVDAEANNTTWIEVSHILEAKLTAEILGYLYSSVVTQKVI